MIPSTKSFIGKYRGKSLKYLSKRIMNMKRDVCATKNHSDSDISINSCMLGEDDGSFSDCKMVSSPSSSQDTLIKRLYSMDTSYSTTPDDSDSEITNEENEITYMLDDGTIDDKKISEILGQDTFIDDYIGNLFQEEKVNNSLIWFNNDFKIPCARKAAIDWIRNAATSFKLRNTTLFKTIYYFDKLSSVKQLNPSHLTMIAAVCLFISCKFNEREYDSPTLHKISRECGHKYQIEVFASSEIKILTALDFRLKIVLPIDFVEYYIHQQGVIFDDDAIDKCSASNLHLKKKIKHNLEKFCVFFLHICSQSYSFWNYRSSVLALAVICASRRAMKIKPYFNKKLINLCQYEPKHIEDCFNKLWTKYHAKFPKNAKMFETIQPQSILDF